MMLVARYCLRQCIAMERERNAGSRGRHFYQHSGVTIASDFEIPEWSVFSIPTADTVADIDISLGTARGGTIPCDAHGVYSGGCLAFDEPDAGRWLICGGERIIVEPMSAERMVETRLFTIGSAWGALGYQRGWSMLHGSGVKIGGKAVLFAGEAEHGKSTLAAALVKGGAELLSDDLSRVDAPHERQRARLWPSAARVKLWNSALEHFGWQDRDLVQDHFRDQKFHLGLPASTFETEAVDLAAIFVLGWDTDLSIKRLRGAEAVRALADGTMYRKQYLELMGKLGEQVVHCARIAAQMPVYRLTRPKDFAQLDKTCALITHRLAAMQDPN
ncbi:MAG: hypothetical protein WAT93_14550 [Pontixanthobacter sp.]